MTLFFFDSDGGLWVTCSSSHPAATAFGPSGVARSAQREEVGLPRETELSPAASAIKAGRFVAAAEGEEWDTLAPIVVGPQTAALTVLLSFSLPDHVVQEVAKGSGWKEPISTANHTLLTRGQRMVMEALATGRPLIQPPEATMRVIQQMIHNGRLAPANVHIISLEASEQGAIIVDTIPLDKHGRFTRRWYYGFYTEVDEVEFDR